MLGRWILLAVSAYVAASAPRGSSLIVAVEDAADNTADSFAVRVAMLTPDRSGVNAWCMGLLIAPDSVLTYAHCAQELAKRKRPLAWAFFGNSKDAFYRWRGHSVDASSSTSTTASPSGRFNASRPKGSSTTVIDANAGSSDHGSDQADGIHESTAVGDTIGDDSVDWVPLVYTAVHPQYVSALTPDVDLAIVRLQSPRAAPPFPLASNMAQHVNATNNGLFVRSFTAFQVSNAFVTTSRSMKVKPVGAFQKVGWRYCAKVASPSLSSKSPAPATAKETVGQVCVVASIVEDRGYQQLKNTFVLLDNTLVGLSVGDATNSGHRFAYLSDQAAFINDATRKQEVWDTINITSIVGGVPANFRGYLAGLRKSKSAENFCLGALIAPNFVLTAAHCVKGVEFSQVSVGSQYAAGEDDGEQIKVKQTIIHPDYVADTFENDFALVELEYISIQTPVTLYNGRGSESAPGSRLTMYGYGPTVNGYPRSQQSVSLPVVASNQCLATLKPVVLDDAMLCAGGEEGKDACHGDSGGPLVVDTGASDQLVATASFGRSCGVKGMPAVYAITAKAAAFIDKHVDGHRWSSEDPTPTPSPSPSGTKVTKAPGTSTPKPATTGSALPSSPPTSPSDPEARSNDEAPSSTTPASPNATAAPSRLVDQVAKQEAWAQVSSMRVPSVSTLVVGPPVTSFTRDAVTSILVRSQSSPSSDDNVNSNVTPYKCTGTLEFHSSGDLSALASSIFAFDSHLLRSRASRFPRQQSASSSFSSTYMSSTCIEHRR